MVAASTPPALVGPQQQQRFPGARFVGVRKTLRETGKETECEWQSGVTAVRGSGRCTPGSGMMSALAIV